MGLLILGAIAPFIGPVLVASLLWEAIDRGFDGGFVASNKELSGFLMSGVVPWLNRNTKDFNSRFVKHPEDHFIMNCIYSQGVGVPLLFGFAFWFTKTHGFSLSLCFVYHVLRIGPYFMQFAYFYTLCHKEGKIAP
jgi:hypothetical protein